MATKKVRLIGCLLIVASLVLLLVAAAKDETHFRPVGVESVGRNFRPILTTAPGTVVPDVLISEKGEVKNIQVRRAVAYVTEVAVSAVKSWTFKPPQSDGKAVASRITVAVTFDPPVVSFPHAVLLTPLIHQDDEMRIQSVFQPPEVTHAVFSPTPTALNVGTVIIEATVDETGKGRGTKVLHDVPPSLLRRCRRWRIGGSCLPH
jgi:TonB family protein